MPNATSHPHWSPSPLSVLAERPLRVVIVDDNPVVRAGLVSLLSGREDVHVLAEAADGRQAFDAVRTHSPDVVLLDVRMPGVDGLSALPHLVALAPVLMLTYSQEAEIIHEALRRGAGGYLVHGEFTPDGLVAAARDVRDGRAHFTPTASTALLSRVRGTMPDRLDDSHAQPVEPTPGDVASMPASEGRTGGRPTCDHGLSARELEVMELIVSGMTNAQISATCFISEKTVKNHVNRIFAKLNAANRGEAIAVWLGTTPHGGASPHA